MTCVRIKHSNLTLTDQVGVGCDRFNGAQDLQTCVEFNYTNQSYDFYNLQVPADARLPGGGGYRVRGVSNPKPTVPTGQPSAVTLAEELEYLERFRHSASRRGAVSASTAASTGRAVRDLCYSEFEFSRWGFAVPCSQRQMREGHSPRAGPASIQL